LSHNRALMVRGSVPAASAAPGNGRPVWVLLWYMWTTAPCLYVYSLLDEADAVSPGIRVNAPKHVSRFESKCRAGSSGATGSAAGRHPEHIKTGAWELCEASGG